VVKAIKHMKEEEVAKEQQGGAQSTGGLDRERMKLRVHLVRFMVQKSLMEEDTHEKIKLWSIELIH
jgi:hypothetical protein